MSPSFAEAGPLPGAYRNIAGGSANSSPTAGAGPSGLVSQFVLTASGIFPSNVVASVVGIGACAGGFGGFLFSAIVPGFVITYFGYVPVFVLMGVLHPLALVCVHVLMGHIEPQ